MIPESEVDRTSPKELADLPADFWLGATVVMPAPKQAVSLRIDADVLAWFRTLGPRYQTRMNAVLRAYMTATQDASPNASRSRSRDERTDPSRPERTVRRPA